MGCRLNLAVSSSPRPWIDVIICFIRKIQHGGYWERSRPQGPKHVHNFLMNATSELSMRAWNWNVTDSKKTKEIFHDFVRGQSVAETCFSHWG